jgi:hypothetical protein
MGYEATKTPHKRERPVNATRGTRPSALDALARATQRELVQRIEYFEAENRMLRGKLPRRIDITPAGTGQTAQTWR